MLYNVSATSSAILRPFDHHNQGNYSKRVFFGHGIDNEKGLIGLGREVVRCLEALGARVEAKEYEGLGHWYWGDGGRLG